MNVCLPLESIEPVSNTVHLRTCRYRSHDPMRDKRHQLSGWGVFQFTATNSTVVIIVVSVQVITTSGGCFIKLSVNRENNKRKRVEIMGKTKTGKIAAACTFVSFLLVVIAFTTPNWLETDGKLNNATFIKIGLWQVCFNGFQDTHFWYDTRFYGCWWVFEEEYYIIQNFLLPPFFVATQFFFTLCMTLLLIGGFLAILYSCCSRQHEKYQLLLWATGANLTLAGICGIIAVIIFGAEGDSRIWMPNWEHNDIGWSYALGVIGSVLLCASGILFLIEARRFRKKQERILNEEQKTHTTI